jgi:hypothetical protein
MYFRNNLWRGLFYRFPKRRHYPVIIDTGTFRDKACFIFAFTWETDTLKTDQSKVQNLGHVFTVILDEEGNEVAYSTCK